MQLENRTLYRATILSLLLCMIFYVPGQVSACTIGVASGGATEDGRPMLWKSRDVSNYLQEFHYRDTGYIPFISVTYSGELNKYYGGVNAAGFAIGNSDSYNLGESGGYDDGRIHKKALETCRTVNDFQLMLDSLINEAGGVLLNSNYAVIDAEGGASMFECATKTYTRFDADAVGGFIVRANYSYSGDMSNHANLVEWGLFRHDRAYSLWNAAVTGGETSTLTQQYIFRHVVRDLAIEGTDPYPLPYDGQIGDYPYGSIPNAQAICRNKTRSVVVVQGVPNMGDPDDAVLWTMCGNPLASVPLPLWVRAGSVPVKFDDVNGSLICDRGAELADWICDYVNPDSVVNTWKLTNPDGDGLWDAIFPWSDGVFAQVNSFTSSEDYNDNNLVEAFQNNMATQIYVNLVEWQPSCPEWTSVPDAVTSDENTLIEFNVLGISTYNEGLTIAYNQNDLPGAAQFTDNGNGNGSFSWQTTFDDARNYTPIFTLSDGVSTADASVPITVNNVNRAPEWTSVPDAATGNEGSSIEFSVSGIDPDSDNLTITYSGDGIPPECLTDNGNGTASFSWQTAGGDEGEYTATFTISDGVYPVDAIVPISVTVAGPAEPQTAFASGEQAVAGTIQGDYTYTATSDNNREIITERQSGGKPANRYSYLEHIWTFEITGFDLELHAEAHHSANGEGDDFILAGSFDGQNYTNLITVTKTADDDAEQTADIAGDATGNYYVRVTDTDRTSGNRVLDSFSIDHLFISYMTGDVPNRAPIWTDVPDPISGNPDTPIEFTVTGSDPDDDNLNISVATDVPEGYNFTDNGDGTASFSWQTAVDDVGDYTATFTITDGEFYVHAVVNIDVDTQPEPGTMYVDAINLTENVINKNFTTCEGVVTILDLSDDAAVEGAEVLATWSGLYNANVQGTTDGNGQVTFVTGNVRRPNGYFTLTVTDVVKDPWTYDSDQNVVTTAQLGVGGAGWGDLIIVHDAPIPEVAMLNPAYPNPFNNRTTIGFGLPEDAKVRITVYDLTGRRIETLTNRFVQAGWHSTTWTPQLLANGEYIIRLEAGGFVKARRLVFLK